MAYFALMNSPLVAGIVGTIGATIFCAFLARFLHAHADEWGLPLLAVICLSILAVCLALGWWMDKRDRDRKARAKSGRP